MIDTDSLRWIRARFYGPIDKAEPTRWPPPGPFWETGCTVLADFTPGQRIIVAYVKTKAQIKEFWPAATDIETAPRKEIIFTDRFNQPDWW
jgi:hypothetical protein